MERVTSSIPCITIMITAVRLAERSCDHDLDNGQDNVILSAKCISLLRIITTIVDDE